MARPRTPTAKLRLQGTFRDCVHGDRRDEPTPNVDISTPRGLSPPVRKAFKDFAARLDQVATDWDTEALIALAKWWVQFWEISDYIESRAHLPEYTLQQQMQMAWKNVERLLGKFGMTPADRAAMERKPSAATPDDEWSRLLA